MVYNYVIKTIGYTNISELTVCRQTTLASLCSFQEHPMRTRKQEFLEKAEQIVPWQRLHDLIEPSFPKVNGAEAAICKFRHLLEWHKLCEQVFEEVNAQGQSVVFRHESACWGG